MQESKSGLTNLPPADRGTTGKNAYAAGAQATSEGGKYHEHGL